MGEFQVLFLIKISEEGHFNELINQQEILAQFPSMLFRHCLFYNEHYHNTHIIHCIAIDHVLDWQKVKPTEIHIPSKKEETNTLQNH